MPTNFRPCTGCSQLETACFTHPGPHPLRCKECTEQNRACSLLPTQAPNLLSEVRLLSERADLSVLATTTCHLEVETLTAELQTLCNEVSRLKGLVTELSSLVRAIMENDPFDDDNQQDTML